MNARETAVLRDRVARARLAKTAPPPGLQRNKTSGRRTPPPQLAEVGRIDKFVEWLGKTQLQPFTERCEWCGEPAVSGSTACAEHRDLADLDQYEEAA